MSAPTNNFGIKWLSLRMYVRTYIRTYTYTQTWYESHSPGDHYTVIVFNSSTVQTCHSFS